MPELIARAVAAIALFAALPAAAQTTPPLLNTIFQDHGVLQRDRPIAVWGHARPGETVAVTLADHVVEAKAGKDGVWRATLPALPAGGPLTLTVTAGELSQSVSDLLIGDVWLCSGQSNMAMAVSGSLNGPTEIANANDPQVRILSVQNDVATSPANDFIRPVEWKPVSPASIGTFSAACWYMARDLRKSQKVPLGLINASWGGTAINAWRPEAAMKGEPALAESLQLLSLSRTDPARAAAVWGKSWDAWWRGKGLGPEPWQPDATGEWKPVPKLTYWEQWGVPELTEYNGLVWYRTEITLTPEQAKKGATLSLGVIDDLDVSYVNGTGVGATSSWDVVRSYRLAPGVLKPGVNRITVSAFDSWGPGGMAGTPEQRVLKFDDGTSIPLPDAAQWQYRTAPGIGEPPHAPWESAAGLGSIYNGMIAPLGNYGLKGIAWYQGESDAGMAETYGFKLKSMIGAWRGQFANEKLPFLVVQLPNWGPRVTAPAESGFADIRNQQLIATQGDNYAGLVVTVDVGDVVNLHPENKQAVGHRLAHTAEIVAYGAPGLAKGPTLREGLYGRRTFSLWFGRGSDADALVAYSGTQILGFELCGPKRGTCRFASAKLVDGAVVIETDEGPVNRIRYCWGDSPLCNLYTKEGLPVSPFETKID